MEMKFIENTLIRLVGRKENVKSVYGGFHITVPEEKDFKFKEIFEALLEAGQSVSVEKIQEKLTIVSK